MAPPPVCHALFLSFHVSEPGSPGAGTVYFRHSTLPVAPSSAAMKSRTPRSPPAAPITILSLTVGGDDARRIAGDADDQISPQRRAAVRQRRFLLPGVHAPDDPAHIAGTPVDLVDHAPLIDHIEIAVLGERGRLEIFVRRRAAERDRVSKLEALDVGLVDAVERRVALRIIGPVV